MSKTVKSGSTKSKFHDPSSVLFAMGYVDLIFKLKLSKKDLLKSGEDQNQEANEKQDQQTDDRYYQIKDLNKIEDLSFLKEKKELWDKIILTGGNDTINQLLFGNRISKRKCKIEYFAYNLPKFQGNDEFFTEIFKYVCNKNNLVINETPLEDSARFTLNIILEHNGEKNTISIGTSYEEEEKERIKKKRRKKGNKKKEKPKSKKNKKNKNQNDGSDNEEDKIQEEEEESDDDEDEEDEQQAPDDYEETDAMKEKKIPKFRRGSSILVKLNPTYEKYSMAYFNFDDIKKVPGDFKLGDLNELLKFFKSKGTIIFVNFYKPRRPKIEVEEEEIDSHENDNEIMGEGKYQEKQVEEEEPKEEKKEKKEPQRPTKKMRDLNELYYYTNIFFFDVKQCIKMFDKHYTNFTEDSIYNLKKITRPKVFDYFIKGIAPATKEEVIGMKTGLFIDQLVKLTIIYASRKAANTQEFDCQPYPKINHNNMDLIKQYKDILTQKRNDYYSVFLSSIIIHCASFAPSCQSTEVIYPSFLISLEVIKKKLECEKNELTPDDNIYKVKLDEKIIMKNLQMFSSGGKENGFVLDCTNKQKSTMKDYVSLYDYHLRSFFSSETIRKDLKNKGFIDSKGFIMYDQEHRNVMRGKILKKKKKKVISNEEIMDSIKGIDVPSNLKDKEIDAQKLAETKNLPTEIKLPVNKELMSLKTTGMKKKKKRRRHRSSSRGKSSDEWGSSESDSGNNSGNSGTVSGEEDDDDKNKNKNKKDDAVLLRDKLVY